MVLGTTTSVLFIEVSIFQGVLIREALLQTMSDFSCTLHISCICSVNLCTHVHVNKRILNTMYMYIPVGNSF